MPTSRVAARSVDELIAGASLREPMDKTADSKSGSTFERVVIDGEPYVLKHLHVDHDWLARATGDLACRPALVWELGLLDALPPTIDHAVVGVATGLGRAGLGAALLLRDVGDSLVVEGSATLDPQQHQRFIEHMADLHAAFWGWEDTIGLQPLSHRLYELSPLTGDVEANLGSTDEVPPLLRPGWERMRDDVPAAGALAWALLDDPGPLLRPLAAGPQTFIHGDWKAGNLGSDTDGRTILLDWAVPGAAPGPVDLAWYLAVNCDRLPESKDAVMVRYRDALEGRGIGTDEWWDEQIALALIVGFVQLGWNKRGDELAWWADRVVAAAVHLG
jgi:Phosphotransferase enzyme family